jgi:hypothetical protein
MPTLRKLDPSEVETTKPSQRKQIEQEYDGHLAALTGGDYAIAVLEEGEKKQTVRRRLEAAARRADVLIHFKRTRDDTLIFQLSQIVRHSADEYELLELPDLLTEEEVEANPEFPF